MIRPTSHHQLHFLYTNILSSRRLPLCRAVEPRCWCPLSCKIAYNTRDAGEALFAVSTGTNIASYICCNNGIGNSLWRRESRTWESYSVPFLQPPVVNIPVSRLTKALLGLRSTKGFVTHASSLNLPVSLAIQEGSG